MKVEDVRAIKVIHLPMVREEEKKKEINKLLSNGWKLLPITEKPYSSSMYFVHKKTIGEMEE